MKEMGEGMDGAPGLHVGVSRGPYLWIGIAVVVLAGAAVRAVFLFADDFTTGFDGYYYALQVRSLVETGRIMNYDNSLVFPLLRLFAFLGRDVVFTNKLAVVILCPLTAVPIFLAALRMTSSRAAALTAALFFSLSFSQIYMSFEIIKNGVGMLFTASALYCLMRFSEKTVFKIGALVGTRSTRPSKMPCSPTRTPQMSISSSPSRSPP